MTMLTMAIEPTTSAATIAACPDPGTSSREAARAFKLRRSARLPEAATAFEAAYRCMPTDSGHEERWEHLASYLETVQSLPASTSPEAHDRLCHAQSLVEDYQRSIITISPPPDAAIYAAAEHQRITAELASQFADRGNCEPPTPAPAPAIPRTTASPNKPASVLPAPAETSPDRPLHKSSSPTRPLWIASAITGAITIVPAVIMGVGLRKGNDAETDAGAAMMAGQLQQIRDHIHPDGVRGNRMAYAGAIVGAALLITTVALLTAAGRRTRLARTRVSARGAGVLVRF